MISTIAVPSTEKNYMGGVAKAMRARAEGGGRASLQNALRLLGEPRQASPDRAMREWRAKVQPRFRIGDGKGLFLRFDGQGVTTDKKLAWFGSETQLERALRCFPAAKGMRGLNAAPPKVPGRPQNLETWGAR